MSTLGSSTIHRLSLAVPWSGSWRADVILEGGALPSGKLTLTIGDLSLVGTVDHAAFDAPDRPHAVVVGGLGWERPLSKAPSYQQDAGVRLSTALQDLAGLAGEPLELPADLAIGTAYACPKPRTGETLLVRDALSALVRAGYVKAWRVDPDGVTRFGPRPTTGSPSARGTVLRRNAAVGVALLGIDSPLAFMPGNAAAELDGAVIRRLVVLDTSSKIEAEIWGGGAKGTDAPSVRTSIAKMTAEDFPQLVFGFPRTYNVTKVLDDGRLDLAPPPDAPELPVLPAVDEWTLGGAQVAPSVGDQVLVQFRDANPTRPVIVAFSALRSSKPEKVLLAAGTDAISLGSDAGLTLSTLGDVVIGLGANNVTLAAGSTLITPGAEAGRFLRYGDPAAIDPTTGMVSLPIAGGPVLLAKVTG